MKSVILAGGSGTRLWPVSRKGFPKQFMRINGNNSLLQQSVERLMKVNGLEDIHIITNKEYMMHIKEELRGISEDIGEDMGRKMILEPVGRNTAPAIALTLKHCIDNLGCSRDEVIFIVPSDHVIRPVDKFVEYAKAAERIARQGYIITFGINPDKPETGYGYIRKGGLLKGFDGKKIKAYKVDRFVEKPDSETAKKYVADSDYLWNSGMFAFTIKDMLTELKKYAPAIYDLMQGSFDDVVNNFRKMPEISIDYAVMEKSKKSAVLPLDISWSDVGSWDSLFEILEEDENRNVKIGDVITVDTKNTLVFGNKRLISTVGLEDLVIVETDDAVLVAKKGQTQKVKDIVSMLKRENRKEAVEHTTIYRPWGSYTVLEEGPRYKIKRIVVKPRGRLSLQMHHHRSEHWIVIKGTAKVTTGGADKFVHENESIYVPKSTPHRLENPGKVGLELIEVQNGEYVEEDDILRFDDIYGRAKKTDGKK